ncbi:MAG TPA: sigma-70 family RNA polymerase sigma factor [Polyangiaceae bacterium]|jgi:RNA polymerase sigma factor for flagellar operon FliA|nr:sigma-70 family RNA polymerase sigma factor [Polyangiaceae bacterium]
MHTATTYKNEFPAARETKAAELLPQARRIARAIARGLPGHVDQDDIVGAAYLGVAEALTKLGLSEETTFEAYALRRSRGAIVDQLRSADLLTRTERSKLKTLNTAIRELSTSLGRPPTEEELASSVGMSAKACARVLVAASRRSPEPLPDTESVAFASRSDGSADSPESLLIERNRLEALQNGIALLPPRLQQVIDLYYGSGMTLREIGAELGVSEARAYQLRQHAIDELRISTRAA